MKLPDADRAVIDPAKLRGYLLSETHLVGRFKARFFAQLGYSAEGWEQLASDLRTQHLAADAVALEPTHYGQKYRIRAILKGPSRQAIVVSVWVVRTGESVPRFVTAYPGDSR